MNRSSMAIWASVFSFSVIATISATPASTASMIASPASVEILDPEHHILTLEEDRELRMELHVNKGRGFVLADQHELPRGAPVDLVRVDAVYNPVRRANFTVEETRVGQRTDFDRLTLHVETDGSVDPEAAIRYALRAQACDRAADREGGACLVPDRAEITQVDLAGAGVLRPIQRVMVDEPGQPAIAVDVEVRAFEVETG